MAGQSVGVIFAELDLDTTKYTAAQKRILYESQTMAVNVEQSWKTLGQKSDVMYEAMKQSAINAYEGIKGRATSTAAEIIRAETAKNARINELNNQMTAGQTSFFSSMKANWIAAAAAIGGSLYAANEVFNVVTIGVKAKAIEESFASLSKNAGFSGDALIEKLKEVTNQTVESSDLMRKANRLIIEGFSPEQIVQIGAESRQAARLMGTDVASAYEQVSDAIVNLRQRGLKTAGFVIDLNEAYRKHADKLGIAASSLNDYGKQMALAEAVHQKYLDNMVKTGPLAENEYENIQQMGSAWKSLKEDIGKATAALLGFFTHSYESTNYEGYMGKLPTPPTPSVMPGFGTWESPSAPKTTKEQQQMMDTAKITETTLTLRKEILSVGYQTFEDKQKELEIDRQSAILALQKYGNTGGLQKLTNDLYSAKSKELSLDERIRIQEMQTGADIKEGLIDLQEISGPTAQQRLSMVTRTYNMENQIRDTAISQRFETAKITEDLESQQRAERDILQAKISEGRILPENVAGEKELLRILQDRAIAERNIETIRRQGQGSLTVMSTGIEVQRQLRANQVSLGSMRSGQAGLADLQGEIELKKESLKIEQQVYDEMYRAGIPLARQEEQWNKILETEKQLNVLEASRGQYLAEYGQALDGIQAGLKKYVTSSGTMYTQLSDFAENSAKGMEGSFSNFFQSLTDKSTSFGDKVKKLFQDMANSFIKSLSDMAAKALVTNLFGGQGAGSTGGLFGGLLNSIFGSNRVDTTSFTQAGGYDALDIGSYAQGTNYIPNNQLAYLHKGEAVIPANQNKGGGTEGKGGSNYNITIIAADARSFSDLIKRHPEAIVGVVQENIKRGGSLKTTVRGA
jgi:hypothetical protein